ncbi:MAG: M48 family metallopeptidase [Clostridiales bacterium]|nr:M48 family metallopeptidase [Clostridiales bacterium]
MKVPMEYECIRSDRKTLAIQLTSDGKVLVRAPRRCSKALIESFLEEKKGWILQKQQELRQRQERIVQERSSRFALTEEEAGKARKLAAAVFERKTALYAALMHVSYGRISIRDQKTRWGSCTAVGNLNYNWRLILAPEEVQDYVVVHELAHRLEMNHSPRFWAVVETVLPDYRLRRKWLKEHGESLMPRE